MATAEKSAAVKTVGQLKKFLEGVPDNTKIRGDFDDIVTALLWKKDADEKGTRKWLAFETGWDD